MLVDPSTKSTALPTTTINSVHSTQKPGGKNKKNKKKTAPSEEQSTKQPNPKQKVVAPPNNGKDKPTRFPYKICAEGHLTYRCRGLQECTDFITKKDTCTTPTVLNNPFPAQ